MKRVVSIVASFVLAMSLFGCGVSEEHQVANDAFQTEVDRLNIQVAERDSAIESADTLIAESATPLDVELISALETAVSDAKAVEVTIPQLPTKMEDVVSETERLKAIDCTGVTQALNTAIDNLNISIQQYALVDAPTEAYIIQCLQDLDHVVSYAAVTEDNDPNGNLNKPKGYTSTVFYECDLVDQTNLGGNDVIARGTDGGGSIEVYATPEDAIQRSDYLSSFDGTPLASGSRKVVGTVLVRTSDELTASEQKLMEEILVESLTRIRE